MRSLSPDQRPDRLQVRVPRPLLAGDLDDLGAPDPEGWQPLELCLARGRIQALLPLHAAARSPGGVADLPVFLPAFVDAHSHLDKAFSWYEVPCPPRQGTMAAALRGNRKENDSRTAERLAARLDRALAHGWRRGLRAVRSHIDAGFPAATDCWEAVEDRFRHWADRLTLQPVAMASMAFWQSAEGEQLARRVASLGGCLGGALDRNSQRQPGTRAGLRQLLNLSVRSGCGIDLHLDESSDPASTTLDWLLQLVPRQGLPVPITASHCCSLGLFSERRIRARARALAERGISVVVLPVTNLWLQDRAVGRTPRWRGLAPIHELQAEGVTVAIAGDNVQDSWAIGANGDPLELMRFAVPVTHLHPWEPSGLLPFTTAPARLMGLAWDGVLRPGAPADGLLLEASGWTELLGCSPPPRVLRHGAWIGPAT